MDADEDTPPSATVYVSNLNDRIKIPLLIETLRGIFSEYGTIIDVIAKRNLKAKGQAFVVYDSIDSAQEAIDEVQAFEVFGKQMRLDFAKSRSDATVKAEDGDEALEEHKKQRLAEKERKQAAEKAAQEQSSAKRPADNNLAERPAKTSRPGGPTAGGVVPDEYLPPNKILFLRELPEDYTKEALTAIFSRFPGFKELRMVPSRKGIAFAEYADEEGATVAKEATSGISLSGSAIRVTFQRQ